LTPLGGLTGPPAGGSKQVNLALKGRTRFIRSGWVALRLGRLAPLGRLTGLPAGGSKQVNLALKGKEPLHQKRVGGFKIRTAELVLWVGVSFYPKVSLRTL